MSQIDQMLHDKQTRLNKIVDLLNKGRIGVEDFDSTQEPFFQTGETQEFQENHKRLPELPEGLNRNFKEMYEIIGNPAIEVHLTTTDEHRAEWTIMSVNKALKIYATYQEDGQCRVFDIAYTYMGMGHINILACDLETHSLFVHPGGGANGWERRNNHDRIVKYNRDSYEQFYFAPWLSHFT